MEVCATKYMCQAYRADTDFQHNRRCYLVIGILPPLTRNHVRFTQSIHLNPWAVYKPRTQSLQSSSSAGTKLEPKPKPAEEGEEVHVMNIEMIFIERNLKSAISLSVVDVLDEWIIARASEGSQSPGKKR